MIRWLNSLGFLVLYLTWGLTGFDEEKSCAAGFDMMLRASRLSCWEGVDDWWLSSYCNDRTTRLSGTMINTITVIDGVGTRVNGLAYGSR